jgi:hypothetical protein
MAATSTVSMYSRRRCGLCDEARATILAERERTPFEFREVFIDGDDDLERAYGLRVPVVEVDGEERFEYHVDPTTFRRLVGGSGACAFVRRRRRGGRIRA